MLLQHWLTAKRLLGKPVGGKKGVNREGVAAFFRRKDQLESPAHSSPALAEPEMALAIRENVKPAGEKASMIWDGLVACIPERVP